MKQFAKLYEDDKIGQVLAKLDEGEECEDEGAEIRFFFTPEGLGVCSMAIVFTGEDRWENADDAFERLTGEIAVSLVMGVIANLENPGE